jgi:hypothetical protein
MTVWVLVVSAYFLVGSGDLPSLQGQGRQKTLARFVYPTAAACEAAKAGVREFAQSGGQSVLIGQCSKEIRYDGDPQAGSYTESVAATGQSRVRPGAGSSFR